MCWRPKESACIGPLGRWRPRWGARIRRGPGGRRGRRDRVYEPFGLVIELDGRLAHQPEERWRDKTRDNAAAADGKQTLRYGWSQVKWAPCETAAEVARVLRRRGWGGQPRP